MKSKIKLLIMVLAVVVVFSVVYFMQSKDEYTENTSATEQTVTPFEKAKELKDEYVFYDDVLEQLELLYPDRDNLLSEQQTKQLFPELWIGESIACRAIESASFGKDIESLGYDEWLDSTEVTGKLEPGTDNLSVKVNFDDTVSFLTSASVEFGATESTTMDVFVNNEFTLIASDLESDKFLDTLTISKETGMGVWQSVNAAGLPMTYEIPESQMIYLHCVVPDTN